MDDYARGLGKRNAVFSHDRLLLETAKRFVKKMRRGGGGGDGGAAGGGGGAAGGGGGGGLVMQAPWIARMAATLREELSTIFKEQEEGRSALLRKGVPAPQPLQAMGLPAGSGSSGADDADEDGDECCALCKSMPYLAGPPYISHHRHLLLSRAPSTRPVCFTAVHHQ